MDQNATANDEVFVTEDYSGPNRRKYPKSLEQLEEDILMLFQQFEDSQRKMLREMRSELISGFPNGDLKGHCDYHSLKIKAAQAEEEFWKAARSEAMRQGMAGIFAVLKWVGILTVLGVAYKFGFGPAVAKAFGVSG